MYMKLTKIVRKICASSLTPMVMYIKGTDSKSSNMCQCYSFNEGVKCANYDTGLISSDHAQMLMYVTVTKTSRVVYFVHVFPSSRIKYGH